MLSRYGFEYYSPAIGLLPMEIDKLEEVCMKVMKNCSFKGKKEKEKEKNLHN